MRADTILHALKNRQAALERDVFAKQIPASELPKQQGIWQGLSDAIDIVMQEAKKEED